VGVFSVKEFSSQESRDWCYNWCSCTVHYYLQYLLLAP